MNKHSIVNLKCPCFLFRSPNLDIPRQALFNLHKASALPLRCGSEDNQDFQNPPATRGGLSDGAGTVWSQFGTVCYEHLDKSTLQTFRIQSTTILHTDPTAPGPAQPMETQGGRKAPS